MRDELRVFTICYHLFSHLFFLWLRNVLTSHALPSWLTGAWSRIAFAHGADLIWVFPSRPRQVDGFVFFAYTACYDPQANEENEVPWAFMGSWDTIAQKNLQWPLPMYTGEAKMNLCFFILECLFLWVGRVGKWHFNWKWKRHRLQNMPVMTLWPVYSLFVFFLHGILFLFGTNHHFLVFFSSLLDMLRYYLTTYEMTIKAIEGLDQQTFILMPWA